MQCITRESLQNEKFSLSVLLNKIDIHATVLLQITIKPSITVLTNSFFITLPLNRKASSFITKICLSALHWNPVLLIRTHTAFWRTQVCLSGQAHNACFMQDMLLADVPPLTVTPCGYWLEGFPKKHVDQWHHLLPGAETTRGRNIFWPSSSQAQPSSSPSLLSHPWLCLAQVPAAPWQKTTPSQPDTPQCSWWVWANYCQARATSAPLTRKMSRLSLSLPWNTLHCWWWELLGKGSSTCMWAAEAALSSSLAIRVCWPLHIQLGHIQVQSGTGIYLKKILFKAQLIKQSEAIVKGMIEYLLHNKN